MEPSPEHDPVAPLPLANAEVRLRQARNYLQIVEPLLDAELRDHGHRFTDLLDEVLGGGDDHPEFGSLGLEAASVAHDRLEEAREQLPRVLFNSLLIYADSTIDAMLVDCIEAMEFQTHRAAPRVDEKSPYRRRMLQLQRLGLGIKLPPHLDDAITLARKRRNAVVHEKESATREGINSALSAAEGLLSYLRVGLVTVEEEPDPTISRLERRAWSNEAFYEV